MAAGALKGVYGLLIVFSLTPLWNESEADKLKNANEEERKKYLMIFILKK